MDFCQTSLPRRLAMVAAAPLAILFGAFACAADAAPAAEKESAAVYGEPPDLTVLAAEKWREIDESVDRALQWLAERQAGDGSWETYVGGQPGVTALVAMAFLSRGHQPGLGPYGATLDKAIDYTLSTQRPDGMFLVDTTEFPATTFERGSHTGLYNHAVAGFMLSEAYGAADAERQPKLSDAIERALAFARKMQQREQRFADDEGGFRYYKSLNGFAGKGDSDLSVTGWYVMFFRSAKNAGFDVPDEYVDDAVAYVRRCYDPGEKMFRYGLHGHDRDQLGRGVTGVGLLCLTAAGKRDDEIARAAGQWLLDHPFNAYGGTHGWQDRFHYGAYYCSQAMMQLGGDYWEEFYPVLADTLLKNQFPEGHWPPEQAHNDWRFGSEYSTALTVLALTSPYQLLPIYQR